MEQNIFAPENSHSFIKQLHANMMTGIIAPGLETTLGKYKTKDNQIRSSTGAVVYTPPSASETKKYMDELITFMNDTEDGLNPLIKAAMIHSQFESIHPFSDSKASSILLCGKRGVRCNELKILPPLILNERDLDGNIKSTLKTQEIYEDEHKTCFI